MAASLLVLGLGLCGARLSAQPPRPEMRGGLDESPDHTIQLDPPGQDRVFRLDSEASFLERMRQEARQRSPMERITFPDEPVLSTTPYRGRTWDSSGIYVEPNYLCYRRLLFQQINPERYGWSLGFIEPVVSAGVFFLDVAALPYNLAVEPLRRYECNTGYALPGDPVPLLLYPPAPSLPAAFVQAGTVIALVAIFP